MLPQHVEEEKGAAIASSEHHSLKGEFSNLFNVEGLNIDELANLRQILSNKPEGFESVLTEGELCLNRPNFLAEPDRAQNEGLDNLHDFLNMQNMKLEQYSSNIDKMLKEYTESAHESSHNSVSNTQPESDTHYRRSLPADSEKEKLAVVDSHPNSRSSACPRDNSQKDGSETSSPESKPQDDHLQANTSELNTTEDICEQKKDETNIKEQDNRQQDEDLYAIAFKKELKQFDEPFIVYSRSNEIPSYRKIQPPRSSLRKSKSPCTMYINCFGIEDDDLDQMNQQEYNSNAPYFKVSEPDLLGGHVEDKDNELNQLLSGSVNVKEDKSYLEEHSGCRFDKELSNFESLGPKLSETTANIAGGQAITEQLQSDLSRQNTMNGVLDELQQNQTHFSNNIDTFRPTEPNSFEQDRLNDSFSQQYIPAPTKNDESECPYQDPNEISFNNDLTMQSENNMSHFGQALASIQPDTNREKQHRTGEKRASSYPKLPFRDFDVDDDITQHLQSHPERQKNLLQTSVLHRLEEETTESREPKSVDFGHSQTHNENVSPCSRNETPSKRLIFNTEQLEEQCDTNWGGDWTATQDSDVQLARRQRNSTQFCEKTRDSNQLIAGRMLNFDELADTKGGESPIIPGTAEQANFPEQEIGSKVLYGCHRDSVSETKSSGKHTTCSYRAEDIENIVKENTSLKNDIGRLNDKVEEILNQRRVESNLITSLQHNLEVTVNLLKSKEEEHSKLQTQHVLSESLSHLIINQNDLIEKFKNFILATTLQQQQQQQQQQQHTQPLQVQRANITNRDSNAISSSVSSRDASSSRKMDSPIRTSPLESVQNRDSSSTTSLESVSRFQRNTNGTSKAVSHTRKHSSSFEPDSISEEPYEDMKGAVSSHSPNNKENLNITGSKGPARQLMLVRDKIPLSMNRRCNEPNERSVSPNKLKNKDSSYGANYRRKSTEKSELAKPKSSCKTGLANQSIIQNGDNASNHQPNNQKARNYMKYNEIFKRQRELIEQSEKMLMDEMRSRVLKRK